MVRLCLDKVSYDVTRRLDNDLTGIVPYYAAHSCHALRLSCSTLLQRLVAAGISTDNIWDSQMTTLKHARKELMSETGKAGTAASAAAASVRAGASWWPVWNSLWLSGGRKEKPKQRRGECIPSFGANHSCVNSMLVLLGSGNAGLQWRIRCSRGRSCFPNELLQRGGCHHIEPHAGERQCHCSAVEFSSPLLSMSSSRAPRRNVQ